MTNSKNKSPMEILQATIQDGFIEFDKQIRVMRIKRALVARRAQAAKERVADFYQYSNSK